LLLVLSGCALSEEPPIVRTAVLPTVTPTVPPDAGRPLERVNLARGAEIFTGERGCHLCHGLSGEGNGPTAQSFTCQMASFRDAPTNQSKALTAWFALVTNGNGGTTSCLMPPWKNQLSEQDRWAVTSYSYSLHYTPEQIERGKSLWAGQCASCHGMDGAAGTPNLRDSAALINRSDTQVFRLLTDGLTDGSHKFDQLSETERRAVTAYTRTLGWDRAAVIGVDFAQVTPTPAPTAVAAIPDTETITVSGTVRNGTTGGTIPAALPLTLRIIEATQAGFNDVLKLEAVTTTEGSYAFANVPRRNGLIYVVAATYAGVLQTNRPVQLQTGSGPTLDLPFTVFETTTDPAVVRVEVQRIFVDFLDTTTALIQQGILLRNTGDRLLLPGTDGATLRLPLPPNAREITLGEDTPGFRANGSVIEYNAPLPPGDVGVQFSYQQAFQGDLLVQQANPYLLAGLNVFVPRGSGAFIADPRFSRDEPLFLDSAAYDVYVLRRLIDPGSNLSFTVRFGTPDSARRGLLLGVLFAGGGLFALIAFAIWRLNRAEH
jgi:mono/diheme cytochrome c family protein